MSRRPGLLLLGLQSLLLLLVGGRLLVDRAWLPRGWARTLPVDPNLPIRGRYVSLRLQVPVAGEQPTDQPQQLRLLSRGGRVVGVPASSPQRRGGPPGTPAWATPDGERGRAMAIAAPVAFFLPEHSSDPSRQPPGRELWVEVSLPPAGPPRPIRLGVKRGETIEPLPLR